MRFHLVPLLIGAMCLALVAVPSVQAKPKQAQSKKAEKKKDPDTVLKIVDLAKAKKKAVKKLEKALKEVEGVTVVVVAKKKNEVKVWHKPEVEKSALIAAVEEAGFKVEGEEGEEGGGEEGGGEEDPYEE